MCERGINEHNEEAVGFSKLTVEKLRVVVGGVKERKRRNGK
jgi:hypothetical protein